MGKKLFGFILSILGVTLVFKYLYKNACTAERSNEREVKKDGKKDLETVVRKSRGKLNQRQEDILKLFRKRDTLLPTDVYSIAPNLSTRTLRRDMTKLVELGFVVQEGNTKDSRYILKK